MTDTTPPADVTDLNAADSAAMLVAMSAAYKASQPAPGPWGLSTEEANSQLQAMADAYNKTKPTALPAADAAVLGDDRLPRDTEVVSWPAQNTRNKLSVVQDLRQTGIPDQGIARIISGEPYSKEDYAAAVRWRERVINDPVVSKELLDGSAASRHVIQAMAAIIALGPPEEK